ncbi:MAG: methionine--tRNA ligase subunit beta, partial [Bacteroidales bacterium]|nr:methionine--tRNA ligase subunit beta [Bacteroidales bacterium]
TEPWKVFKTDPDRVATILNIALQITANITILAEPFLPFTTAKLGKMINASNLGWSKGGDTNLLASGHAIEQPELLFDKIEGDEIDKQLAKLMDTKLQNEENNKEIAPQKEIISYEDFMKMDIRISKVLAAEVVPKTQKLLKLEVDTGIDKRTIVSGIAEYFKPEQVVGREVCVLVNLEPRKIRGIESHGMILMAKNSDDSLRFVQPNESVDSGSTVS